MTNATRGRATILLVEDNARDVDLTREAFDASGVTADLRVAVDGEECLDFLRKRGRFQDASRPDVILLDLNMPKKNGKEVLAEIKADPQLRRIPVVILTTSKNEDDIMTAYDLQAACYIVKPTSFLAFTHVVKTLEQFWFGVVALPPR